MSSLTADEIVTLKHKRNYIQFGGARPGNPVLYAGQGAQYMVIDGVGVPETGGVDPVFVPHPNRQGYYRLVSRKLTPPGLAKASLTLLEKHGSIPRQLQHIGCQFNLYELTGACKDLADFNKGWTDYVLIYSGALVTDKDLGTRTAFDTDNQVEDKLALILSEIYPVGVLSFGQQASSLTNLEVVDIVYGSNFQCGECGVPDDGTSRIYAICKSSGAGSPGLPGTVVYTVNGGATWTEINITSIGASANPTAIDIVGSYLVVVVSSEGAYYYATLNVNGVPGTWTKVTTGFVVGANPNDIYVASPREVWFCGDAGYVYKATDITAGVTAVNEGQATANNLIRIDGVDETIIAVGEASTVIKSVNRGVTFASTTTSPSAIPADITAVEVLDSLYYWVGTGVTGRLYYTVDGGETWTQKNFAGNGSGTVYDIVFATRECGYFSHSSTTPTARLFATMNGGEDWAEGERRILNLPTFDAANRLATPRVHSSIDANNIAIAGLAGDGTSGILLVGVAGRL